MRPSDLLKRVSQLILQSDAVVATRRSIKYGRDRVNDDAMVGLRAATLSFISMTFGKDSPYYLEYNNSTNDSGIDNALRGHSILLAIQAEIDGGWIFTVKKLISAEIFSDFLEMAEHLLAQGYKDPAAVMIGSVLEENLRQLCIANEVEVTFEKNGDLVPKTSDRINADLAKAELYSKLDFKAVTAWLGLRNSAAHGKYEEYTSDQVAVMLTGVTEFLARINA